MIEKNADFSGLRSLFELVHCKDCIHILEGSRKDRLGFCSMFKNYPYPDFFCKYGIRKKESEKEITRDEKLDAIIHHVEVKGGFDRNMKFKRNDNGKVYVIYC